MVSSAAMTAGSELDKTILLRSAGGVIAGQYAAAYRIMQAATLPVNSLILAAAPRMFRTAGQARKLTSALFIATLCYAFFTALAIAVFSPFARIVLGDGFAGSEAFLRGLCFIVVTNCLRQLVTAQMTTTDMQKSRNLIEITGLVVSIALLLLLIPSLGPWGAIIALGVADTSVILLGFTRISRPSSKKMAGKNEIF
jgi:O-antigen/teichoic acid export membrane protein